MDQRIGKVPCHVNGRMIGKYILMEIYNNRKNYVDTDKPLQDAMDVVLKRNKKNATKFAALEEAAQVYEGIEPPKGGTWKEHYLKMFLSRQRTLKAQVLREIGK